GLVPPVPRAEHDRQAPHGMDHPLWLEAAGLEGARADICRVLAPTALRGSGVREVLAPPPPLQAGRQLRAHFGRLHLDHHPASLRGPEIRAEERSEEHTSEL